MLHKLLQPKIALTLVTVFFVSALLYWYLGPDDCSSPLTYRIGTVDEGFGLTKDELLRALFQAEELWEEQTYVNLLEYKSDGELAINFVFDNRQEETIKEQESRFSLDDIKRELEYNQKKYNTLKAELDVLQKQYNAEERNYRARQGAHAIRVERSTGEPASVEALRAEQKELDAIGAQLETDRVELNKKVDYFNSLVGSYGEVVESYNANVDSYNQNFAGVREFDQGDYQTDGRISIYQYDNHDDLVMVLAHEFGHALGLDHVLDPEAVMYFQLVKQNTTSPLLRPADIIELQRNCDLVRGNY